MENIIEQVIAHRISFGIGNRKVRIGFVNRIWSMGLGFPKASVWFNKLVILSIGLYMWFNIIASQFNYPTKKFMVCMGMVLQ